MDRIAQQKRGCKQIQNVRDRSPLTPFSFAIFVYKKKPGHSFLELHNKIISKTISPIAQWDRIGIVAMNQTGTDSDPIVSSLIFSVVLTNSGFCF